MVFREADLLMEKISSESGSLGFAKVGGDNKVDDRVIILRIDEVI